MRLDVRLLSYLDEQDLNRLELLNNSPCNASTNDPLDMLFGSFRTLINTHNRLKSLIITSPALDFPSTHLIFRTSKGEILDVHPTIKPEKRLLSVPRSR